VSSDLFTLIPPLKIDDITALMSEEDLLPIPRRKIIRKHLPKPKIVPPVEPPEQDLCPICTEPLTKAVTKLSCGHTFCPTCITIWLLQKESGAQTCPVCRNTGGPRDRLALPSHIVQLLQAHFSGSAESKDGAAAASASASAAPYVAQRVAVYSPRIVTMDTDTYLRSEGQQGSSVTVHLFKETTRSIQAYGQYMRRFPNLEAHKVLAQTAVVHLREYDISGQPQDYIINPNTKNIVKLNGAVAAKQLTEFYDISRERLQSLIDNITRTEIA